MLIGSSEQGQEETVEPVQRVQAAATDAEADSPQAVYMSVMDLAKHFKVENVEALRKRLERYREAHLLNDELFIESKDRAKNKPKYAYNVEMVGPIVQKLKLKDEKRPTGYAGLR